MFSVVVVFSKTRQDKLAETSSHEILNGNDAVSINARLDMTQLSIGNINTV
jgi:hypothetical protein